MLTAVDAPNVTVIIGFFPGDSFITRSAVHNLLQMLTGCQGIGNPMRWYRNAQDCWFLCYERPSLLKRSKS